MLEGRMEVDEAVRLRREIAGLEKELQEARDGETKAKAASADAIHAIRALRKQLEPLYNSLRMIFGEISRVDAGATETTATSFSSGASIWQERISKSGTIHARILQVMVDGGGGEMSLSQIRSAANTGSNTSTRLGELIAKNWVRKVGHGTYALKV
jgi:hypothetical protein